MHIDYILHLADNALILGHRNSEWCGHGPVLEQDIAITNISLDLIGQARNFYQYAAAMKNDGSTEDSLAYLRDTREFKNCLLAEQPNGDWATTIVRQFFLSNHQFELYTELGKSSDAQIAAICNKALKEVTYHLKWSSEWVIRLGDGTGESKARTLKAVAELWTYTGELFIPAPYESASGVDTAALRSAWMSRLTEVFLEAHLPIPADTFYQSGGKTGLHSEHLGFILAEMQFMQRAYPNLVW
jgi:ring-1,2-phenylacetyl-CoA epoxidase subunit PaaC